MVPKAEAFLNRLSIVKLPTPRDLFSRFGNQIPRNVVVEDGTPLLAQRKNDLVDSVNKEAEEFIRNNPPKQTEETE